MRYVFVVGLAFCLFSGQAKADIVTPTAAKATTQFGLGVITVESLINGAGLDGVGDIAMQLHNNVTDLEMWFSGCEDGMLPGGLAPDCGENIFAVGPVNEQALEFCFEHAYDLNDALVWQYNENNAGVGPLPGRGVASMEILVSPTKTADYTSLGTFLLAAAMSDATIGVATEPAQVLALNGNATQTVQRVRFNILEAHSGAAVDFVGLSEVRFDGVPSPVFVSGDCNGDGILDISDLLRTLDRQFAGVAVDCLGACDPDGDGVIDVSTVVFSANFQFLNGPPPVAPYPDCGNASTAGVAALGCATPPAACMTNGMTGM